MLALYAGDDLDALVAFGITPVAVAEDGLTLTDIVSPWDGDSAQYDYVDMRPEPNLEQIAGYAPDLILINDGFYADIGEQLSAITPTVAYETAAPWQESLRLFGAVFAQEARAEELVTRTESLLSETAAEVRACVGDRTISVVQSSGGYFAIGSELISGGFLSPYGFTFNELLQGTDEVELSPERLDELDADVILVTGEVEKVTSERVFAQLPAAQEGRVFEVDDDQFGAGGPNALRAPWAVENLIPPLLEEFGC